MNLMDALNKVASKLPFAPDKIAHVFIGLLSIAYGAAGIYLYLQYGIGIAPSWFSMGAGAFIEMYQWVRKEGTPDWFDWIATSSPGWVITAWWYLH